MMTITATNIANVGVHLKCINLLKQLIELYRKREKKELWPHLIKE